MLSIFSYSYVTDYFTNYKYQSVLHYTTFCLFHSEFSFNFFLFILFYFASFHCKLFSKKFLSFWFFLIVLYCSIISVVSTIIIFVCNFYAWFLFVRIWERATCIWPYLWKELVMIKLVKYQSLAIKQNLSTYIFLLQSCI